MLFVRVRRGAGHALGKACAGWMWYTMEICGLSRTPAAGPFGEKAQTYVDHAASGQPLPQVEAFLQRRVLAYYANTHTETTGGPTSPLPLPPSTHTAHPATSHPTPPARRCTSAAPPCRAGGPKAAPPAPVQTAGAT
jgi:hypothetical protein